MEDKNEFSNIENEEQLLNLQRSFAEIIRRPLLPKSKMRPDERSELIVKKNDRTDSHGRMEFYARQYWWRILDSFDSDFICLSKVLAPSAYKIIRNSYLEQCFSRSFTLRNLGRDLVKFIRDNPDIVKLDQDLILDAIRFDWGRIEAFDSSEFKPLTVEDVSTPDFSEKLLYLQPFVQLCRFKNEVDTLFKSVSISAKETTSNTNFERIEEIESDTAFCTVSKNDINVAIYRREGRLASMRVSDDEYLYLKALQTGISIVNLLDLVEGLTPLKEENLQLFFQKMMALSQLTLVTPKGQNE